MTDPFDDEENETPDQEYVERLEEALQRARELGDADEETRILLNLGDYYAKILEYEGASQAIEKAIEHLRAGGQYALCISPLFQLARIYRVLDRNDRAFSLYHLIIEYAEIIDNRCALGYALASKGLILFEENSHRNGLEFIFRGYQFLEDLKLNERLEVKEWIQECRRRIPRTVYDLAVHRSAVSPKTKSMLKLIE